ncbi:MAG: SBBP repeat-containing protein [Promethearchaeota archaeon]
MYFSFLLQGTNISTNEKDDKNDRDVVYALNTSNLVVCEWHHTWGGFYDDCGLGTAVDSSGNIYLAGETTSFGAGHYDMVLVKYDGNGVQQWNRTWGGSSYDHCWGVAVDSSCNIYITGFTDSVGAGFYDMVLVKYDGNGVQLWNRTWGGGDYDYGWGVAVDSPGNVYLAGETASFGAGSDDMVLVKYDGNGVQQWNRTWGGGECDVGRGVAVDSSGNIYLAGETFSFGAGFYDMVLVKYDGNGVQLWNRTWGGAIQDFGQAVAVDSSGNAYLVGDTTSFGAGSDDIVLVKYNRNGVQQFCHTWGESTRDFGRGVVVDSSSNIYVAGATYSYGSRDLDMVLVKYNRNGVEQWYYTWGGGLDDYSFESAVNSSGIIYVAGGTYSYGSGDLDMVLVKLMVSERPHSNNFVMIVIIGLSMASMVGVGIAITFFFRKRLKILSFTNNFY